MLRLWRRDPSALAGCLIVAPAAWLAARGREIGIQPPVRTLPPDALPAASLDDAIADAASGLTVLTPADAAAGARGGVPVRAGRPDPAHAAGVIACIEYAARLCIAGQAAGMITAPIVKSVLREAGFRFPGHTEFLAHLAGEPPFAMMLANRHLRVALLTTHLPLAQVPQALTTDGALAVIRITHADLIRRFGVARPRLALCGLNPHAGEAGHFGDEEARILAPAIARAREQGIHIEGPLPADSLFAPEQRAGFDAIIACYHDQGLIPVKALGFGETVNITLGLPFIRTSVDHGAALALAGKEGVNPGSLAAAIRMAREMAARTASDADARGQGAIA